ncbi:MAG: nucleoside deaminase [Clostridiales bacterium]|jgi:tRNA(adenine34) deaminase|nr:nucleoside deaminase [Clostridiales bacterium]
MDMEYFMRLALEEARAAFWDNEVPVGCVIVREGAIIGRGRNRCARLKNSLRHAEMLAIDEACAAVGDWRLSDCSLFVTVEPCPMCAGAIIMTRVGTVYYGARNPKAGCAGSILNVLEEPRFNHRAAVIGGVLEAECGALMTEFFKTNFRSPAASSAQSGQ